MVVLVSNAIAQPPSHDPTQMVLDGGRYWIFTTGEGIWNMSADNKDFNNWRAEPRVFGGGTWPSWINNYVPAFAGNFWAPGIIFMNGKWHVYYSCSTFGSQTSTIGLVTTPSITDSVWTDHERVVHSPGTANVNAIDPHVYKDNEGKVWLLYGSWWDGIVITELDSLTGKPKDPTNLYSAANNRCEAGYVLPHGNYYYLFFNRGSCCSSIHSTYTILMGRSIYPTGPFYDKDSVATNNEGGSIFLHSDGRYIGPGHFGFGEGKLTYHFYDGLANGAARLKIADLDWEDDWPVPVYSRSGYPAEGNYVLSNYSTNKVIELQDADTASGTKVLQFTETGDTSQHWNISYIGNGYYKISPVLAPGKALEIEGASTSSGANVQIGIYTGAAHQQWYIANMGSSVFRIMSRHSRRAIEVGAGSSVEGAGIRVNSYGDNRLYQRWRFKEPTIIESVNSVTNPYAGFILYPNPGKGSFTIDLSHSGSGLDFKLEIYTLSGIRIFSRKYSNTSTIRYSDNLKKGVYLVNITTGNQIMTQKLVIE